MKLKSQIVFLIVFLIFFAEIFLMNSCTDKTSSANYSGEHTARYTSLYPPANEIFYSRLERVNDSVKNLYGISIYLSNTISDLHSYSFQINESQSSETSEKIFIPFDAHSNKKQEVVLKIWAKQSSTNSKKYFMNIVFEPKQLFSDAGKSSYANDLITIGVTDLFLVENSAEDYITYQPTQEEIGFAKKEFANEKGTPEINAVAKTIISRLVTHQGIPSDSMDHISPFAQYQKAVSGKDKVWCGNIADVFAYAGVCLNIPVRRIGLGYIYDSAKDPVIMNAEGHTTTEVYDQNKKEWYLADLTFNLLSVTVKGNENHRLNFMEFYSLLNDPSKENSLIVEEFMPAQNKTIKQQINKSSFYHSYKNFYKLNQRFFYVTKTSFL